MRISVIADILSGSSCSRMTARPTMLPTDVWLGSRKKYTARATTPVASVMTEKSLTVFIPAAA